MAACELRGELKYRNGETKKITVKAENNLQSVISSVKKLNSEISEVLTSLVEQEKCANGNKTDPVEDEEDDDSDEQEDAEEAAVVKSNSDGPPPKRLKP